MEERRPISKSSMPGGYLRFLDDPEGTIGRWQKRTEIRQEFESLKKQEAKIKKSPTAAPDLREKIEKSYYDDYQPMTLKKLGQYLKGCRGDLSNLDRRGHIYGLGSFFTLEVLLLAADQVAEYQQDGITDEAKKEELARIENEKARIKEELAAVSPPEDFNFNDGAVDGDLIDQFISHWKNLQAWTRGEVDPRGISLKYASEIEQKMFYRLGLDKIIPARSAKYRPFEPGAAK